MSKVCFRRNMTEIMLNSSTHKQKNKQTKVCFINFIQKYDQSASSLENVNENDRLVLVKNVFIQFFVKIKRDFEKKVNCGIRTCNPWSTRPSP